MSSEFDKTVHVRDRKTGNIKYVNAYRKYDRGKEGAVYERPPGSGKCFYADGSPVGETPSFVIAANAKIPESNVRKVNVKDFEAEIRAKVADEMKEKIISNQNAQAAETLVSPEAKVALETKSVPKFESKVELKTQPKVELKAQPEAAAKEVSFAGEDTKPAPEVGRKVTYAKNAPDPATMSEVEKKAWATSPGGK